MNFIQHYRSWRVLIETDDRMTAQHITLYLTLFDYWNMNRFRNPIMLFRQEAMYMSRIGSATTYVRCLRELSEWGYIHYMPSKNPQKGSRVEMYTFDMCAALVADAEDWRLHPTDDVSASDTAAGRSDGMSGDASLYVSPVGSVCESPDLSPGESGGESAHPSAGGSGHESADLSPGASGGASHEIYKTNNTNRTNSINALNHGASDSTSKTSDRVNDNTNPHDETAHAGRDHRQYKKSKTADPREGGGNSAGAAGERGTTRIPQTLEEATAYFVEAGSDALEAQTFYSHYKSLGWKVNGAPVEHWQALADKWLIRSKSIAASKPREKHPAGRLHVDNNKNYAEPL